MKKKLFVLFLALLICVPAYAGRKIRTETFSQDLSASDLSESFTAPGDIYVLQVLINGGAAITETITLTHDAFEGSNYDVTLDTQGLSSEQYYVYQPGEGECPLARSDILKITCTSATATSTLYGKIQYRDFE